MTRLLAHRAQPRIPLWLGLVIGAGLIVVGLWSLALAPQTPLAPAGSVDFALGDLSGQRVSLADFRGHPVLVNLWATWCPPCRAEMPDLAAFYQRHQQDGLVLLAVNTSDDPSEAARFARDYRLPFPVLLDADGRVMRLLHASGLPGTFVIDRRGALRLAWSGPITAAVLNARVAPLIAE